MQRSIGTTRNLELSSEWVPTEDPLQDGIPCLWFPAPKAATVILFFHASWTKLRVPHDM